MLIFKGAFTGTAAVGGFVGATISKVISTGMARSVYSNEAGWGTSPMVHASSQTVHPVEQGLWGSFEVFVDTFIVCTITSLAVSYTHLDVYKRQFHNSIHYNGTLKIFYFFFAYHDFHKSYTFYLIYKI